MTNFGSKGRQFYYFCRFKLSKKISIKINRDMKTIMILCACLLCMPATAQRMTEIPAATQLRIWR
jgi:hypothetical protein